MNSSSRLNLDFPFDLDRNIERQLGHAHRGARVLTALPCVDQSSCGTAMTDATTKNASHSRHFLILISASTPPTPIVAMKLCAWTSGNRPAMTPAAIIRRSGKELRAKSKESSFDV